MLIGFVENDTTGWEAARGIFWDGFDGWSKDANGLVGARLNGPYVSRSMNMGPSWTYATVWKGVTYDFIYL